MLLVNKCISQSSPICGKRNYCVDLLTVAKNKLNDVVVKCFHLNAVEEVNRSGLVVV